MGDWDTDDVAHAQALVSGQYQNFVLVRAMFDGLPVNLIGSLMTVQTPTPSPEGDVLMAAGFVHPMAIMLTPPLAAKLNIQGAAPTQVEAGTGPAEWTADAMAGRTPKLEHLNVLALIPPDPIESDGEALYERINNMADHAVETMGGFAIHATEDGKWCVHLGPEQAEDRGCKRDTFLAAMGHAMEHHVPSPGDAILADDDPRVNAGLN